MASMKFGFEGLKDKHIHYIEATYHLHHPRLIEERRHLMEGGAVASQTWVEGTPTYETGDELKEIDLPMPVEEVLLRFHELEIGVYDPPYKHQSEALKAFFNDGKDIIVATGTGSGKTEIFLHSILGQLALEGTRNATMGQRGFRALLLYPMNALVADQFARIRQIFGVEEGADELEGRFGRRVQFGMYTSRTHYPGAYDTSKNTKRVARLIDYYCNLQENDLEYFEKLKGLGRIPTKDLIGFRNKYRPKETQFRTQPQDTELFTRQEMYDEVNEHGGTPDIIITNYSMLEYMLLRPIEQPLFQDTRNWLAADPENQLVVVLDEAHLYRGAQGAEIAMLMRRLMQHLGVDRSRLRFILTSASLGSEDVAENIGPKFAADLTAGDPSDFQVITGARREFITGEAGSEEVARILSGVREGPSQESIGDIADVFGWPAPESNDGEYTLHYLAHNLPNTPCFRRLYNTITSKPTPLNDLAQVVFPDVDEKCATDAVTTLIHLGSCAKEDDGQLLLPVRIHAFYIGLPRQYVCLNSNCPNRRASNEQTDFLGRIYREPRLICDCGSRIFELMSHRTCGAAYLRAYRTPSDRTWTGHPQFLWTDPEELQDLDELHLLLEPPRTDPDMEDGLSLYHKTDTGFLHKTTGHLVFDEPDENRDQYIQVWIPEQPSRQDWPWTWTRCPACGIKERRRKGSGETWVMDLETKGEDPFANLTHTLFELQPEDPKKSDLPNKGRKVLCFSDGRQKAARLARDLQLTVERDSFREVALAAFASLPEGSTLDNLYPAIVVYTSKKRINFFDDSDARLDAEGHGFEGSRTRFVNAQKGLKDILDNFGLELIFHCVIIQHF